MKKYEIIYFNHYCSSTCMVHIKANTKWQALRIFYKKYGKTSKYEIESFHKYYEPTFIGVDDV